MCGMRNDHIHSIFKSAGAASDSSILSGYYPSKSSAEPRCNHYHQQLCEQFEYCFNTMVHRREDFSLWHRQNIIFH